MHEKFLFDVSFDPPAPKKDLEPVPTYFETDIVAAKDVAFAQGIEQGRMEMLSEILSQTQTLIQEVLHKIEVMEDTQHQHQKKVFKDAIEVSYLVSKKYALTQAEKNAAERCKIFLEQTFQVLLEKPEVSIRVNPKIHKEIQKNFPELIQVKADDTCALTDCAVNWQRGGAVLDLKGLTNDLDQLMKTWLENQDR
jgi:hypothetical protein